MIQPPWPNLIPYLRGHQKPFKGSRFHHTKTVTAWIPLVLHYIFSVCCLEIWLSDLSTVIVAGARDFNRIFCHSWVDPVTTTFSKKGEGHRPLKGWKPSSSVTGHPPVNPWVPGPFPLSTPWCLPNAPDWASKIGMVVMVSRYLIEMIIYTYYYIILLHWLFFSNSNSF